MRKTVCLVDVDGTLVDSNDAHAQAWFDVFREYGVDVTYDVVRRGIGMGGDQLLPAVAGISAASTMGEALSSARAEAFASRYLETVAPLPGARNLLEVLVQAGWTLVVASSAAPEELQPLLERGGVDDLLPQRTSSGDADESKPEPDILLAALDRVGATADQALMLGDTPYDIKAAEKAGIEAVALRSGGWSDAELAGAIAIYDDPADLVARFESSPFFQPGPILKRA